MKKNTFIRWKPLVVANFGEHFGFFHFKEEFFFAQKNQWLCKFQHCYGTLWMEATALEDVHYLYYDYVLIQ